MCQFGSKCTVDHKPHGGSERRRNIEKISKYNIMFEIHFFGYLLSVLFTSPLGDPSRISIIKSLTEGRL